MPAAPVFALLLAVAPDDTHALKWKLAAGDVFYAKIITTTELTFVTMGRDISQTTTTTAIMKYGVKSVKAGVAVVELTYLDNKVDAPNLPGANLADKLKGVSFTLTLDEKLKVTKLEGYDKFIDAAADGKDGLKKSLRAFLPEELLRRTAGQIFAATPPRTVAVGDTWADRDKFSLGPLGVAEVQSTLKLDAVKGDAATVSVKGEVTVTGDGRDTGLPVKFAKGDLKAKKWAAKHTFDMKAGRVTDVEVEFELYGPITVEAAGEKTEVTIKQKTKLVAVIGEKNPLDK